MEKSSLLASLRQQTASLHQAVERRSAMRVLMAADIDDDSYLDTLYHLHDFVAWAEPTLRYHFTGDPKRPYHYFSRLNTLIRDIHQLKGITPVPAHAHVEPCFFRALGMAYVIEGSTAGGQLLARRLQRQLGRSKGTGLSYFNFHRRGTWSLFSRWLDTIVVNEEQIGRCVDGAKDCFSTLLTQTTMRARC